MLTSVGGDAPQKWVERISVCVCCGTGSSGSNMGRTQKDEEEEGH